MKIKLCSVSGSFDFYFGYLMKANSRALPANELELTLSIYTAGTGEEVLGVS
jgi:hypothetical protein